MVGEIDSERYARFHTHPLNDSCYFPSVEDEANSYIAGPNILFSQHQGVFYTYLINRGKSRKIFERDLKNQEKVSASNYS